MSTPAELAVAGVLPPATVGVPYFAVLAAEGGTRPFTWEADGLPPGLAVDGERVTGIPEQYGTWPVTLLVTDAHRATAADGQVLTVQAEEVPLPPGADPALAYPRADVEWIVYQAVRDLGGTVDWSLSAAERDPRTWITVTGVQVDVRAASKPLAAERADLVRRAVAALPWAAAASGVIAAVDVLAGPFWEADATGQPRYVVRFGVTSHPPRRGTAGPAARGPVDPVLRFARPSVELAVRHAVRNLGGTVMWCYAAADRQPRGWLAAVDVQVDVRANSKSSAWRRADACRRAVSLLPWAAQPHGVIASVDVTDGPFWLPDPDGRPRYVARYAITAHPSRPARQSKTRG